MPAHNEQVYTPTTSWQPEGPHVDIPANQGFLINSHINEDRLVEVIGDRLNPPVPAGRPLLTTNKIIFVVRGRPGICILDQENFQNLENAEDAHLDGRGYNTRYSLFISVSQQCILNDVRFEI